MQPGGNDNTFYSYKKPVGRKKDYLAFFFKFFCFVFLDLTTPV